MITTAIRITICLMLGIITSSCVQEVITPVNKPDDLEQERGTLKVSGDSIISKSAGDTASLTVMCESRWRVVVPNTSWCEPLTLSGKGNGNIKIEVKENTTYQKRRAIIYVVDQWENVCKIPIEQQTKYTIIAEPNKLQFQKWGTTQTIKIIYQPKTLDLLYVTSFKDWITTTIQDDLCFISVTTNPESTSRSGKVLIEDRDNKVELEIIIEQQG